MTVLLCFLLSRPAALNPFQSSIELRMPTLHWMQILYRILYTLEAQGVVECFQLLIDKYNGVLAVVQSINLEYLSHEIAFLPVDLVKPNSQLIFAFFAYLLAGLHNPIARWTDTVALCLFTHMSSADEKGPFRNSYHPGLFLKMAKYYELLTNCQHQSYPSFKSLFDEISANQKIDFLSPAPPFISLALTIPRVC